MSNQNYGELGQSCTDVEEFLTKANNHKNHEDNNGCSSKKMNRTNFWSLSV